VLWYTLDQATQQPYLISVDTCDSVQDTILRDDVTLNIVPGFLPGFQQIVKKLILYGMLFFMDENFLAGSALLIVKKIWKN
jgi:hypothetical protein